MAVRVRKWGFVATLAVAAAAFLSGCSSSDPGATYRTSPEYRAETGGATAENDKMFGGLNLFSDSPGDGRTGPVAVNAYLWRASLDTVAFMPLASADPFGGVIITDWFAPPATPDERFKVNIYILGRDLRADGLKVTVFRQTRDLADRWSDAVVGSEVSTEFENAVLSRARELRLSSVAESE
ncbi:MAG: DUF3576 domain-containing protein [Rhodobacteraceae bacterium]|nr:DUF3576 domain-containing protein [Paracoccaceae bacterium]